ncbi:hypothetical protein CJF32_00006703 [Rutstroemia sp. NJR-2017a WRK4]|nr:hypothetical protein CJF32_00006703 [Rutstroemia sp. NJR-2017a WRK4]
MSHVPQRFRRLRDKVVSQIEVAGKLGQLLSKLKTPRDIPESRGPCNGFFTLPVELRHEVYTYLFKNLKCRKGIFLEAECNDPFDNDGAVLFVVNRWFLNDAAEFLCIRNPRFTLYRPSLCKLSFSITENCVQYLRSLEMSVPAYETNSLEPIFEKIIACGAPLTSLSLHLTPTFPGSLSYPWPMYIVPRLRLEAPYKEHWYNVHPGYLTIEDHSKAAMENVHLSNLWIGKLDKLRYLKIQGQPEFSVEFELAIVKLHLRMMEAAKLEESYVSLSPNNGPRGRKWYYEIWITPSRSKSPILF